MVTRIASRVFEDATEVLHVYLLESPLQLNGPIELGDGAGCM